MPVDFDQYKNTDMEGKEDSLKSLSEQVQTLEIEEVRLKEMEEQLSAQKESIKKLKREIIPSIMDEADITSIEVKVGHERRAVKIEDKVFAEISEAKKDEAYRDMIQVELQMEGMSETLANKIIQSQWKSVYIVEEVTGKEAEQLIEAGIPFQPSRKIHWATLRKWAKSVLERGLKMPESISSYKYREAKITRS